MKLALLFSRNDVSDRLDRIVRELEEAQDFTRHEIVRLLGQERSASNHCANYSLDYHVRKENEPSPTEVLVMGKSSLSENSYSRVTVSPLPMRIRQFVSASNIGMREPVDPSMRSFFTGFSRLR